MSSSYVNSDVNIAKLGSRVGAEWPLLGLNLGYSQAQIEQLQQAYPRNASGCITQLLTKWRDAIVTYEDLQIDSILSDTLRQIGRVDLALEVKESQTQTADVGDQSETSLQLLEEEIKRISFHGDITSDTSRFEAQTNKCIAQWKQKYRLYVETKAWTESWDMLSHERTITISGNPGDGKSTMAYYLLSKMADKGYKTLIVSNPDLIEKCYDPTENVVFFVDDAFGTPSVCHQLVDTWLRMHAKISSFIESGNFGLILATRKQVLMSCHKKLEAYESYVNNIIDLTDNDYRLSEKEKVEMFQKYCNDKQITVTDKVMNQSRKFNMSGFPLLCKLYTSDTNLQLVEDFFLTPLSVLNRQLQILSTTDPKAYCGLVLILINDGRLSKSMFDVFGMTDKTRSQVSTVKEACNIDASGSLISIHEALRTLDGVYVSEVDEYYQFTHDAIFDAVTFVFGERFPREIIKICSPDFLHRRVRSENWDKNVKVMKNTDLIAVPKRLYKDLAVRFVKDLIDGNLAKVFYNPSLFDRQIQTYMVDQIKRLTQQEKYILLHKRDRQTNRKIMYLVCYQGVVEIAKCLIEDGATVDCSHLLLACDQGHIDMVDLLVQNGVNIDQQPETSGTGAIHVTAARGNFDMLKHIIDIGADVQSTNAIGITAIYEACRSGNVKCVKLLLDHGANPEALGICNRLPIHQAARIGNLECSKLLVEVGADPFAKDSTNYQAIHFAAECKSMDVLGYLLDVGADPNAVDDYGRRPLHGASRFGRAENIRLLIERGADALVKDYKGRQALHIACMEPLDDTNDDYLQLLIDSNVLVNDADNDGKTALHYACRQTKDRGLAKVKLLATLGANIHSVDKSNMQPLTYACDSGSTQIAKFLIERGADVHWKGFCGRQAVHFSSAMDNTELTTLLIKEGANFNATSVDGMKPIHYACRQGAFNSVKQLLDLGYTDIARLLLQYGADSTCRDHLGRQPVDMLKLREKDEELRQILTCGLPASQHL